ncbi:MAG: hypothetical protein VX737_06085 [Pseudomonadota bacterium]|nr:hypothetical protein [Pseudomonadota bacterium]
MSNEIKTEYEDSWQKMMRKYLLASIAEKNPEPLANGPLSDSNPSGITKVAKNLLDKQSGTILSVADEIWLYILEIQNLMQIRNEINEKCMESEEEANNLLKTTNSVQKLIEHVSEQEEKYINLSDSINNNTIHIVQSYLQIMKKSIHLILEIADNINNDLALNLTEQNKGVESEILNSTSILDLERFTVENTLTKHSSIDPIDWCKKKLEYDNYDDFILIQTMVLIVYRYAMSQAVSSTNQTLDIKNVMKKLITYKNKATEIMNEHDLEKTFNLDDFAKQKTSGEDLKLSLNINPEFLKKIKGSLNELKIISDSRHPKEDENQEVGT